MLAVLEPVTFEYPDGQLVHTLAPVAFEYVPAAQFAHRLPDQYRPAAHVTHTLAFVAPGTIEYAPAEQFVHDALPLTFLNFPATQVVQTPPSGPVYPELHLQSEIDFDEVENGAYEFTGHAVHVFCFPLINTFFMYIEEAEQSTLFKCLIKKYLPLG
jgi:hypothetical protein